MSTRAQLNTEINAQLIDNTQGLITPAILRGVLHDMVDSTVTLSDSSAILNTLTVNQLNLPFAGQVNWNSGQTTLTQSTAGLNLTTSNASGAIFTVQNNDPGTIGANLVLFHNSASPAVSDNVGQIIFTGFNSTPAPKNYATIQGQILDITPGSEDGQLNLNVLLNGASRGIILSATTASLSPSVSGVFALGTVTLGWSNGFFATGAALNFGAGDVLITHSANALTFTGASSGYSFDANILPTTNNTIQIGSGTLTIADLFLGSGAVIDWGNGTVTLTEGSGTVTLSTATNAAGLVIQNTDTGVNGATITLYANSASPAANDVAATLLYKGNDSASNITTYGFMQLIIATTTDTLEDANYNFGVLSGGSNKIMRLSGGSSALYPSNGPLSLGIGVSGWANLFISTNGVIDFGNNDVRITHSANTLAFTGASTAYSFDAPVINTSTETILSGTAIPAGGTAGSGYKFSSTSNFGVFFGSGAPSLSAAKGSLYLRSDGSTTNDRAYINTNGSTTWTAITTVA